MPPSGETAAEASSVDRLYPDLTQFYFSEGLEFGVQRNKPVQPNSPYQTLLRPDYPIYPELVELNIREEDVNEIAPDYPTDNSNEDVDTVPPDYDLVSFRSNTCTVQGNLNRIDTKVLNDKTIEFLPCPEGRRDVHSFQAWMSWRTQVNRQLAAMILLKHGKKVPMRPSELERKPLSTVTIRSVIDDSTHRDYKSALPGKPYIMYGIPRVSISRGYSQLCM